MKIKISTWVATNLLQLVLATSIATAQATDTPAPGEINYLQVAVDYADCMLQYGRDRYGEVRSPLFANLLIREKEPKLPPYPLFR